MCCLTIDNSLFSSEGHILTFYAALFLYLFFAFGYSHDLRRDVFRFSICQSVHPILMSRMIFNLFWLLHLTALICAV